MAFGSRPGHTRRTYDQGIPPRIAAGIVFRGIPVNYGTFCGMGNAVCQQFFKREYGLAEGFNDRDTSDVLDGFV